MTATMTVAKAHAFFKAAHAGQVDKQGRDYYEAHLVPIAEALAHLGQHAVIAGLGHDYIEDVHDGDIDAGVAALRAENCPEPVIAAIVSVTRLPGETYPDLITRSCADPLGVHIKLADNGHNIASNPGLARTDPKKAESLLHGRYLPARDRLIEARTRHQIAAGARVEYRIQSTHTDDDGTVSWADLCPLPANTDLDEALTDLRSVPSRRLVKVYVTETFEALA